MVKNQLFISMCNNVENPFYYLNEQGHRVFTEEFHLKRGFCCESKPNHCKHCPFQNKDDKPITIKNASSNS